MPYAAKKPCAGQCGRLVARGYCEVCQAKGKGKDTRPSAAKRLYGRAWRAASQGYLRKHPLCAGLRNANGEQLTSHGDRIVPATLVDHIEPHCGDLVKFWDRDNWQGGCQACHSYKTANEDGGFGRGSRSEQALGMGVGGSNP